MEQIPVLQFALGKFILIHYHLKGGRGEGGGGGGGVEGGLEGLEDFWNHMLLGGGGGREGDQLSLTEKVL